MKKIILMGLIILLILVSGCSQQITCNKPYILVGTECCLDQNSNGICDRDEVQETKEEKTIPIKKNLPITKEDSQSSIQLKAISPSDGQIFNPGEVEITFYYDSMSASVSKVFIYLWYYVDGAYSYTISEKRKENCPIGYNQKCSIKIDLSGYAGKRIGYFGNIYTTFSDKNKELIYSGWKGMDGLTKQESIFIEIKGS